MRAIVRVASIALLSALLAMPAGANPSTDPFLQVLQGIDTIPTRAQLESRWPDARERMLEAAGDDALPAYPRQRAIGMLALFPDAGVRVALERLASHDAELVRYEAVYILARTFGRPGDAALVKTVADALEDRSGKVRQGAIRGLGWVAHPSAENVLQSIVRAPEGSRFAGDGAAAERRLAQRSLERRAKLLETAPATGSPDLSR